MVLPVLGGGFWGRVPPAEATRVLVLCCACEQLVAERSAVLGASSLGWVVRGLGAPRRLLPASIKVCIIIAKAAAANAEGRQVRVLTVRCMANHEGNACEVEELSARCRLLSNNFGRR
eukprot:1155473-Pelagomonas_calceolata.AAC.5